jgi:hypothetical protein
MAPCSGTCAGPDAIHYPWETAEAALAHMMRDGTEAAYQRGNLIHGYASPSYSPNQPATNALCIRNQYAHTPPPTGFVVF